MCTESLVPFYDPIFIVGAQPENFLFRTVASKTLSLVCTEGALDGLRAVAKLGSTDTSLPQFSHQKVDVG